MVALSQHSSVYRCNKYNVIAIYTNVCNIYHIFVYVHIISLVVICFKLTFLYLRLYGADNETDE